MNHSFVLLLSLTFAVAGSAHSAGIRKTEGEILFCGNSYMGHYRINNSLAFEFERIANSSQSKFDLKNWGSFRKGGSTIAQRWNMTAAERKEMLTKNNASDPKRREVLTTLPEAVMSGQFDLVILQQNSKARNFVQESKPVVNAARRNGAEVILFMTWKGRARPEADQQRITSGYLNAGKSLKVPVVPVGEVWAKIAEQKIPVDLYLDGGHPTSLAHHINAMTLYAFLTRSTLEEIPLQSSRFGKEMSEEEEKRIRQLIVKVVAAHVF